MERPRLQPLAVPPRPARLPRRVTLTPTQEKLLRRLVAARGDTVTREAIEYALWGADPEGGPLSAENTIAVTLSHLRKVLPPNAITTVYGIGYRLAPEVDVSGLLYRLDDKRLVLVEAGDG